MTRDEHYREAERLVSACPVTTNEDDWEKFRAENLAEALVHATLALVPQPAPRCDCMNVIGGPV